jgi:hypothetical protein
MLINEVKDYYVLENTVDLSFEDLDGELFVNGNLAELSEEKSYKLTPKDGDNNVAIYTQDSAGNKSPELNLEFSAFQKEAYEKVGCAEFSFALNTNTNPDRV